MLPRTSSTTSPVAWLCRDTRPSRQGWFGRRATSDSNPNLSSRSGGLSCPGSEAPATLARHSSLAARRPRVAAIDLAPTTSTRRAQPQSTTPLAIIDAEPARAVRPTPCRPASTAVDTTDASESTRRHDGDGTRSRPPTAPVTLDGKPVEDRVARTDAHRDAVRDRRRRPGDRRRRPVATIPPRRTRRRPTCPASSRTSRRSPATSPIWSSSPTTRPASATQLEALGIPRVVGPGRRRRSTTSTRRSSSSARSPATSARPPSWSARCRPTSTTIARRRARDRGAADVLPRARQHAVLASRRTRSSARCTRCSACSNIADTAEGGNDYPQLSAEFIITANPDLIFLADAKCCGESAETVAARDGWDDIAAVKNGDVDRDGRRHRVALGTARRRLRPRGRRRGQGRDAVPAG